MYKRLKDFNWVFSNADYNLYSSVEMDDDGTLTFELNRVTFTLSNFIIHGAAARITATCEELTFAFTGTAIAGIRE